MCFILKGPLLSNIIVQSTRGVKLLLNVTFGKKGEAEVGTEGGSQLCSSLPTASHGAAVIQLQRCPQAPARSQPRCCHRSFRHPPARTPPSAASPSLHVTAFLLCQASAQGSSPCLPPTALGPFHAPYKHSSWRWRFSPDFSPRARPAHPHTSWPSPLHACGAWYPLQDLVRPRWKPWPHTPPPLPRHFTELPSVFATTWRTAPGTWHPRQKPRGILDHGPFPTPF